MMRLPDDSAYRKRRAATRAADAKHDAEMQVIAARGGITLDQLLALDTSSKDAFITKHAKESLE